MPCKVEVKSERYKFFQHKQCEFFPCHKCDDESKFNCLFCYCPLYAIKNCGGNFVLLENGTKDCSNCLKPHLDRDGILETLDKVVFGK